MSIVTKTGDRGSTSLMYNRRVSKCDPRVEACGAVDELNAALGLARATGGNENLRGNLLMIQKDLVRVMGELATSGEDLDRYKKDGFCPVSEEMTVRLDDLVRQVEAELDRFKDWVMPGGSPHSAALDMARANCRRAERRVCALIEGGEVKNWEILAYLNRLSDLLWLSARWVDQPAAR